MIIDGLEKINNLITSLEILPDACVIDDEPLIYEIDIGKCTVNIMLEADGTLDVDVWGEYNEKEERQELSYYGPIKDFDAGDLFDKIQKH